MQRFRRLRVRILAVVTLGVALAPLGAHAAAPAWRQAPGPSEHQTDEAGDTAWVGRYCTRPGCRAAAESGLGNAAGFALAAAAMGLLARRRRA